MVDIERGILLATLDNGTKIYQKGVFNGSFFVELKIAVYTIGTEYDFGTGEWTDAAAGFSVGVGEGSAGFGVSPEGVGDVGLGGSVKGPYGSSFDLGFVISEDGKFTTVGGVGVGFSQLGLSAGFKLTDQLGGDVSGKYDTVQVRADGTVITSELVSSNETTYGTGFKLTVYDANGVQVGEPGIVDVHHPQQAADLKAGIAVPGDVPNSDCFVATTAIDMWPVNIPTSPIDEDLVVQNVWQKPIKNIAVGDWVTSFDKEGKLQPARVSRTFSKDVKIILDFFGTGVTPGHVYYRADTHEEHKFQTLIDIIRDDGVIETVNGTHIRASTGLPIDDPRDRFVQAITGEVLDDGAIAVRERGQVRLGTRFITDDGGDYCISDLISTLGAEVDEDGLICRGSDEPKPFHWDFDDTLPKPEDYVLKRSGTSLEEIYQASEWEVQRPQMPPPLRRDGGPVGPLPASEISRVEPNTPLAASSERYAQSQRPIFDARTDAGARPVTLNKVN